MILLDTDHLSVLLDRRNAQRSQLVERLESVRDSLAIPIVSVEEHLRAWLAQIHRARGVHHQVVPYARLAKVVEFLADWRIAHWNEPAADTYTRLRAARIRIGTQDLKIASLALFHDAMLLSANRRDFEQIPGLRVEDWLHT
jgi:tRNA(fMet)-specific endonuclease VapC